ncbi:MAG: hypothetical protein HN729_12485 [Candidatus Marinimicrobia bacterium]|jgi:hypothetical protein|nr:hypothetical protein [Candidatus Neomarinimicrobiota bacterium]MBT3634822.1 hypothetical protein [Candidatus Neomarinimicrobiota bacterium]MBT3683564.1 hypothetical protein [Candidatus Neomarinimicrobiota bacterium]MBT3760475.1 hypothetical protein [Candidatus Neomarinimicrobiota bacterium]MBT3896621.1 hypothetical protein [Candidatus Neomarinimicrobiota bacterium]
MLKKVITVGLLGGIVLTTWTLLINGVFRFQANIDMKRIETEYQVYDILKEHITEPGRYIFNPELTSEGRYPDGEPVFSVLNGGVGHESAGKFMLVGLGVFFLAPIIATWMLSLASRRTLSSYPRKVLFFAAIGLLIAIFTDLTNFGIGSYPVKDAIKFASVHFISWTIVGIVVAARIQPEHTD